MSRITHLKLVRDRIPEIIEASGKNCVTRAPDVLHFTYSELPEDTGWPE